MRTRHRIRRPALAALISASTIFAILVLGSTGASAGPIGTEIKSATSPAGNVLVLGSGKFAGAAVYFLSSDQAPHFSCTTQVVEIGGNYLSCTDEWPPITTTGNPVAGPGVNPLLLATVYRSDLHARQVTYAGHPLYAFDPRPNVFDGDNFDEPSLPPWHGVWYLASSSSGLPAPTAEALDPVQLVGGRMVLGGMMSTLLGPQAFPLYTDSARGDASSCTGACAVEFPPLLTSRRAVALPGSGLDPSQIGTQVRPDGTLQVTFEGHALYLYSGETVLYPGGPPFFVGNGDGQTAPNGEVFRLANP